MRRRRFVLRAGAEPEELSVERKGSAHSLLRAGSAERVEAARLVDGRLSLLFEDGRQFCGRAVARGEDSVEVSSGGRAARISLADPLRDSIAHAAESAEGGERAEEVRALMPGRVVEVRVSPGDSVEAGGLLLVLEAMKMQNEIRAVSSGSVTRVDVAAGQAVEGNCLLILLQSK